jgi:superoxide dismutase, Cu-Zn family
MSRFSILAGILVVGLAGCATQPTATNTADRNLPPPDAEALDVPVHARAGLQNSAGETVGEVRLTETAAGMNIAGEIRGFKQGSHGLHIHETGACLPPSFDSAGDHFNPAKQTHGSPSGQPRHAGDLGNVVVRADGTGQIQAMVSGLTLRPGENSLLGGDGTAIVVHADPDDLKTDPAGGAGDRMACGVITR